MIDWTQIIIALVGLAFTAVIIPLVKAAFTWLKSKTENEALKAAIDEAQTVASTIVTSLQQTVVDGLKAKSADGKLTAEDAASVAEMAAQQFFNDISDKSLDLLEGHIPDIEAYIKRVIESQLLKLKIGV